MSGKMSSPIHWRNKTIKVKCYIQKVTPKLVKRRTEMRISMVKCVLSLRFPFSPSHYQILQTYFDSLSSCFLWISMTFYLFSSQLPHFFLLPIQTG